ncbi:hypothetical protein SLEP1_g36415 [Rubroshorea leprosula]|uniref:non-specific serine/threonine protein kinase n=1 Tax=Rubroshorea leprosula TaxID=152421 RepID=A0AAV5KS01_9ROSI|nr:hypothetical protein SLEP1_g36415 [Rubroshorea leprosula]
MGAGNTLVFKPGAIFILAVLMAESCAGHDKHVEPRKLISTTDDRPGSISIDCGVNEDYPDEQSGIYYKSDSDFVKAGENKQVSPRYILTHPQMGQMLQTLRSFPEGKKNCYNLKPEQGKGHHYMFRAMFYYGNYDGLQQPPSFEVYLGVNFWTTVSCSNDMTFYYNEIIQFLSTDTIDVCLVNTGSGIPIISALELRLLNDAIYQIESRVLGERIRYDVIDNNFSTTRYKDDVYDRIWKHITFPGASLNKTMINIDIQDSNNNYRIPTEILKTAIQPSNRWDSLSYWFKMPTDYFERDLYVYFHFAEIVNTTEDQRREISITLNGVKLAPITLEYLKPLSIGPQNFPIKGFVNFSIDATAESSLPPLLNAFEIYMDVKFPTSPTHLVDVDAIMDIKQMYKISRPNWQGDPCVPGAYEWSGLHCGFENSTMRITYLNLSSSNLEGEISSSFFSLTAMVSLDLSNNKLTGPVPEFLAQLPKLKVLDLSGNKFKGQIPKALMEKSNSGTLQLRLDENLDLCLIDTCENNHKRMVRPIVASAVSVVALLILLSVLLIICIIKRRRQKGAKLKEERSMKSKNKTFTYSEISNITTNFTMVIGEGGFGKVYLGTLNDGTHVAVKVLSSSSKQGYKEFQAEAQLLIIVHHKNLVSLVGYCDEDDNKALVYENLVNGNLRQHLSDGNTNILSWIERLQIAVDAAHGLEYLHNGCRPPIVHRDLKTSNILLTENMQAKIADFGLSRAFSTEFASHISTCPAGTPGYLDPEFHSSGIINKKSDVYSFGIVLLELVSGQPVILRGEEPIHIIELINPLIERGDIRRVIDPRLQGEFNINAAWKAVEIAMACVLPLGIQRPDMSQVLLELKECLDLETGSRETQKIGSQILNNSLEIAHPLAR